MRDLKELLAPNANPQKPQPDLHVKNSPSHTEDELKDEQRRDHDQLDQGMNLHERLQFMKLENAPSPIELKPLVEADPIINREPAAFEKYEDALDLRHN